jgi:hypothetical protein
LSSVEQISGCGSISWRKLHTLCSKSIGLLTVGGREMSECKSVDRENQRGYYNVDTEIMAEKAGRLESFVARHGLYDKFIEEDKAGKR